VNGVNAMNGMGHRQQTMHHQQHSAFPNQVNQPSGDLPAAQNVPVIDLTNDDDLFAEFESGNDDDEWMDFEFDDDDEDEDDSFVPWSDHDIPHEFKCPISLQIMKDPVKCSDGFYYERRSIVRWLREHDRSPMTNLPLDNLLLRSDSNLVDSIKRWMAARWQIFRENESSTSLHGDSELEDNENDDYSTELEEERRQYSPLRMDAC